MPLSFLSWCRTSRPGVIYKQTVLKNFTEFTGKLLRQILFFNKAASCKLITLFKKVSGTCTFRRYGKGTFSRNRLRYYYQYHWSSYHLHLKLLIQQWFRLPTWSKFSTTGVPSLLVPTVIRGAPAMNLQYDTSYTTEYAAENKRQNNISSYIDNMSKNEKKVIVDMLNTVNKVANERNKEQERISGWDGPTWKS